ncbi:hypothetical protein [Mucilaginibacter flavidus]|uniref:hypothetical protein n=1 Tax=Mucilaginibacter flavidus TaxID=2949309 RepID=UPI002092085F|nr:hypothetical protein [Mucilaginibacter flavidus]MCO5949439.1 hypothetical protein [Mucilaginibacter flavidus]
MTTEFSDTLRIVIYAIVMFFIIPLVFCGFNWVCVNGLVLFFDLKSKLSFIAFWLLFLVIGTTIIYVVRYICAFIAMIIINLFSKICPIWRYKFSEKYTVALSIISILFLMYGFWNGGEKTEFRDWLAAGILLWANYAFARDLVKGLKKFHETERDELFYG